MGTLTEIFHQDVEEEVTCATFSDDLEILVLGFDDGTVSIYNVVKKQHAADLEPNHSASITSLAISPDSKWISVGRATGSLANFLTRTAYLEQVVIGHNNLVHSVQISANSKLMVSSSACGVCIVYSLEEEKPLFQLQLQRPGLSCSISYDNRVIAIGTSAGDVFTCVWQSSDTDAAAAHLAACRLLERRLKSRAKFHPAPSWAPNSLIYRAHRSSAVTAVAFARQCRLLATGGSHDRRITVADWDRLVQLVSVDNGHASWIAGLRWSRDDRCLTSWADQDCVRLWRRRAVEGDGEGCQLDYSMESEVAADLEQMCSVFCCSADSPNAPALVTVAGSSSLDSNASREKFQLDERDLAALTSGLGDADEGGGSDQDNDSQLDDEQEFN